MAIPLPAYFKFKDWDKFSGIVYRWDVDKTYLDTKFESIRQLVKIPFEKAVDKIAVRGAPALAKNIRVTTKGISPMCFITSSPKQLQDAISGKLLLDGVYFDDIKFKDQIRNIKQRKFSKITDHITYKLSRLLWGRLSFPATANEILFGDDSEQDPFIYNLYADLLRKEISKKQLSEILLYWNVDAEDTRKLCIMYNEILEQNLAQGEVLRIFINLATNTDPFYYSRYGSRTVGVRDYFEAALVLFHDKILNVQEFLNIYKEQKSDLGLTTQVVEENISFLMTKLNSNMEEVTNILLENKIIASIPKPKEKKRTSEGYWENTSQKYMQRFH